MLGLGRACTRDSIVLFYCCFVGIFKFSGVRKTTVHLQSIRSTQLVFRNHKRHQWPKGTSQQRIRHAKYTLPRKQSSYRNSTFYPPFSRLFQTVSNAHSMLLTVLTATTDCLKRCRMKSTAHKLVLVVSSTNYLGREAPSHKMGSVCFQSSFFLGGGRFFTLDADWFAA